MAALDIESRRGGVKRNNTSSASTYLMEHTETQWTSWLVPVFVVVNISLFVVVMYLNDCPDRKHTRLVGKCVARLKELGALEWTEVAVNHQRWRLITCIWLHAGVIHLLVNMLTLVFIGIRLEQQFGFVRIGILYLLSGFGGSVLSSLFIRNDISVGASGALFGLLGAMLSELITNWTIYTNKGFCHTLTISHTSVDFNRLPPRLCSATSSSVGMVSASEPSGRYSIEIQVQALPVCALAGFDGAAGFGIRCCTGNAVQRRKWE
ncbi:hypothetical protein V6N13_073768 [Hibiscus sabdariffa]